MTDYARREILAGFASAAAALGCRPSQSQPAQPITARDRWEAFRAEFQLSPDWIHFAGFLLASHPRRVREAIERHRKRLDDNPVSLEEHMDPAPILKPASMYMGVAADEIALTDSTTMGLGVLYTGLPLRTDDDVLTSTHDHYSTHESLRLATTRAGAKLRMVPMYERPASATVRGMADAIAAAIVPATRVVAITWVHSSTGVKTPIRAIADVVAAANAKRSADRQILLCVDGVHGFGVEDAKVGELGCDFFAAGTHKWMFGPRGTGVLWGRKPLWPTLTPTIPNFGFASFMAWIEGKPTPPTTAESLAPGGFHSFEHRWAQGEAFELHLALGMRDVTARIRELNRQCKTGLAAMKHVTLHTPIADEVSAGIITFEVAGMTPDAVVKRLHAQRIIASTTPYKTSYARLAPGLINSSADVERALREIRALA